MGKKQSNSRAIIYILSTLELGGAQKVCLELFKSTDLQKTFLITGTKGPLISHVKNNDSAILLSSFKNVIRIHPEEFRNFLKIIQILKHIKNKFPHAIVHTHSTKAGFIGRWAAFFAKIPVRVHTIHGFAFHKHQSIFKTLFFYFIELITSFITTHFICVSSHDVKNAQKVFPFFSRKYSLIRAAVQKDFFTPASKTTFSNEYIFGSVSCFKPQKNIFDLLKAFEYTHKKNPRARLEIIGDGVLKKEVMSWIYANKLHNSIVLHGWQTNVKSIMCHWNAFVLSSLWEGLPCAIIEARLLKLPILSYNTGGISDVVSEGKNGFLFEQGKWKHLANKMIELSKNKTLQLQLASYPDSLHDFHPASMIDNHKILYEKLLKEYR